MSVVDRTTVGFVPGVATAVVGTGFLALIEADPRSDLVGQLWSQASSGVDVVDLVDQLTSGGLRRLPPFVVVSREGDVIRAIARGEVELSLSLRDGLGEVAVTGSGVSTWVEHVQRDVESLIIQLAGDLSEMGAYAITHGVVPASRLVWPADRVAELPADPGARWVSPPAAEPPPTDVLDIDAEPATGAVDARASALTPMSMTGAAPVPETEVDADTDAGPSVEVEVEVETNGAVTDGGLQESTPEPASSRSNATENATIQFTPELLELDVELDPEAPAQQPDAAPDLELSEVGADPLQNGPADHGEPDTEDEPDDYDHLFGATQFRPVSAAGVSVSELVNDAAGDAGREPSTSVISAVPQSASPAVAPGDAPSSGDEGDHDGMTISLAQLRQMQADEESRGSDARGSASAALPSVLASMVHAVECPSGHLNPPSASVCRACDVAIEEQAHVTVPRPVLGLFRFADGHDVEVARPMLLGRSPKADGPVSGELPELVALDSPSKEVSGTHLEVRLEAWQVLVVDRHSTNGTTVRLPRREPVRLHPGEAFPIVPGSVVDLAGEVSFVFEVTP